MSLVCSWDEVGNVLCQVSLRQDGPRTEPEPEPEPSEPFLWEPKEEPEPPEPFFRNRHRNREFLLKRY